MNREEHSGFSLTQLNLLDPQTIASCILNAVQYLDTIIYSSAPNGKEYYFNNPAVERMIGITSEEVFKNPYSVMRMILPEDFHRFRALTERVKEGQHGIAEYRLRNRRGEVLQLKHSAFPVIENDTVVRIDGIIMDITKEKKTDTQLRRSDDRFRNFIETSDDFVFVIDRNGNFINVNKAGALYLEYMPLEMTGKHILEFIQEERKGDFARSFQEVLRSKGTASFEAGFVSKYGKNVVFEIKAHTLYDQHILDGVIGIGTNATERLTDKERHKELNNKLIEANRIISIERDRAKQKISILEELNRLKNDFVSNVSHELRTPLASIIGFSETIDSDRSMSDEMRIEFNQIILSEAKRLSNLINDVLDISRIEEGKISLSKSELNIIELVQPLVQQYKKRIEEKGIVFWTELPKQEVMIYGDRTRLYQVFEHLFSNAIKFTNEGRITILAQTLYREFEFIITDTGIGIPHKDIPFIFQKFYKVDRPGTELPGTGLGLSFVKQIIDLHHGFVTIQSEENKGTSIVIKLPIVKQEQADEHG